MFQCATERWAQLCCCDKRTQGLNTTKVHSWLTLHVLWLYYGGGGSCSGTQPPSVLSPDATVGKIHKESHTLSLPHFSQAVKCVPSAHSPLARVSHVVCPSMGAGKCEEWMESLVSTPMSDTSSILSQQTGFLSVSEWVLISLHHCAH